MLIILYISEAARPFLNPSKALPFNPHIQLVCRPFICVPASSSEHVTAVRSASTPSSCAFTAVTLMSEGHGVS